MDRTDGYAQTYADLLSAAKLHPLVADYRALRLAYASSPEYDPYDARRDVAALYRELDRARRRGNAGRAIKFLDRLLEGNCLDARAHAIAASVRREMGDESRATYHRAFAQGIISAIRRSGDSKSVETAFVVVSAQEEHAVLEALELRAVQQRRERVGERTFDVFEVRDPGTGQTGVRYFDVGLLVKGIQEGRAKLPNQGTKPRRRRIPIPQSAVESARPGFLLFTFAAMCSVVLGVLFAQYALLIAAGVLVLIAVALFRRLGLREMSRTLLGALSGALAGSLIGMLTGGIGRSIVQVVSGAVLGAVLCGFFVVVALRSFVPPPLSWIIEASQSRKVKKQASPAACIVFVLAMIPGAYLGIKEFGEPVVKGIGSVATWAILSGVVGMVVGMSGVIRLRVPGRPRQH
jgi:hypothetical protein